MKEPTDWQMIKAAKKLHERDGVIMIDSDAKVSYGSDSGVYVAAWVWVEYSDAEE